MRRMGTLGGMDTRAVRSGDYRHLARPDGELHLCSRQSAAVYDGPPHAFLYHQNSMYDLKRLSDTTPASRNTSTASC